MRFTGQVTVAAVISIASVVADSCSGSQLITENQCSTLLDHAPTCFKTGCGTTNGVTSMSSSCPGESPCHQLWTFLRPWWQKENEWCSNCASDKACWIPGWAVLNATQICNTVPNVSLFSNLGSCCTFGNGPVELSDWLGGMCDELEWRARYFANTYGMHQIDWFNHLRAFNFTLRAPDKNETTGYCDAGESGKATLINMFVENIIDWVETFVEIVFFWALIIWGTKMGRKKLKNWKHALLEGVISGLMAVLGNLVTVLVWVYVLRYHDDNYSQKDYVTQLFFILCVRPSIVGYLCFLGLLTRPLEQRMTRFGHYLAKVVLPVQRWWDNVLVTLRLKRRRRLQRADGDSPALDQINVDKARQFLSNWALIIAFAELFMQALAFAAVFWTVNAGRQRQFYTGVLRTEYVLAHEARLWYAGAMIHIIFWIPSVVSLLASSYVHLNGSKVQEMLVTKGVVHWVFNELDQYYVRRRIREDDQRIADEEDYRDDRRATRRQGFLRALLLPLTRRSHRTGENAPMLVADSSSRESSQGSDMGWARRVFLNLRIGIVTRLLGTTTARGSRRSRKGKDREKSTVTETTALNSTTHSTQPGIDPFTAPTSRHGPPEMTTAISQSSYHPVSTTPIGDYKTPTHLQRQAGEIDTSYHGYYDPDRDSPTLSSSNLPARWHKPEPSISPSPTLQPANPRWNNTATRNQDPAPVSPPHPSRLSRPSPASRAPPFRLPGLLLSLWPLRPIIQSLYIWLDSALTRQASLSHPPTGPDYHEFVELHRLAQDMSLSDLLPRWRRIALWGTFACVTVNYVSQWLFWAGMVQVLGDRWCPPDVEFKLEKGIWAAGNFMLVLVSLGFAMFGSGEL